MTGRRQGEVWPARSSPTREEDMGRARQRDDLMLASANLADKIVHCSIHPTEHGLNHLPKAYDKFSCFAEITRATLVTKGVGETVLLQGVC